MSYWIFKAIWMPIAGIIGVCCIGILIAILNEVGWDVPFRWLLIIGGLAMLADSVVNP